MTSSSQLKRPMLSSRGEAYVSVLFFSFLFIRLFEFRFPPLICLFDKKFECSIGGNFLFIIFGLMKFCNFHLLM